MSDEQISISIPLDDDGFLRRKCPLCIKEFKIQPTEQELQDLIQKQYDAYMTDDEFPDVQEEDEEGATCFCPYCGQESADDTWWSQEQLAYIHTFAENIMARIVNEHLIRPMKREFGRSSGGLISISFDGEELKQKEPWINPEENDMTVFELPCCDRKQKLADDWTGNVTHCFFCGFPHGNDN